MMSASLVVDGPTSASVRTHTQAPHMTFVDPFVLTAGKPRPEFARPLPKPAAIVPRYPSLRGIKEDNYPGRVYPQLPYHYPALQGPFGLYPAPYTPLLPPRSFAPPHPPLDVYRRSPPVAPSHTAAPQAVKPGQSLLLRRPFKVPSGKEGSMKHRILTRPLLDGPTQKRRPVVGTPTPPAPSTTAANFSRGSLIRLANGDLRRVEDMRTEDFVVSAESCPALRLDPSTVVKLGQNLDAGTVRLTLSYGEHNTQAEFECSLGHPFFVYGQGWASCSPERSLHCYGLKCHQLQVGDICISLSPRTNTTLDSSQSACAHPRKRRWSAPDQFPYEGNESVAQLQVHKKARQHI